MEVRKQGEGGGFFEGISVRQVCQKVQRGRLKVAPESPLWLLRLACEGYRPMTVYRVVLLGSKRGSRANNREARTLQHPEHF